jgi:hypothetical protein
LSSSPSRQGANRGLALLLEEPAIPRIMTAPPAAAAPAAAAPAAAAEADPPSDLVSPVESEPGISPTVRFLSFTFLSSLPFFFFCGGWEVARKYSTTVFFLTAGIVTFFLFSFSPHQEPGANGKAAKKKKKLKVSELWGGGFDNFKKTLEQFVAEI